MFGLILLVTGLPPILGWLAGVGLVLWSPLWTARQKLLGILVWPGGLVSAVGVNLAIAPTSNQISCDLTADGQIIAGSCVSTDTGVHPAMVALLIAVARIRRSLSAPTSTGRRAVRAEARELTRVAADHAPRQTPAVEQDPVSSSLG